MKRVLAAMLAILSELNPLSGLAAFCHLVVSVTAILTLEGNLLARHGSISRQLIVTAFHLATTVRPEQILVEVR